MEKLAKYTNERSAICEKCYSYLQPRHITRNPNHIYQVGTMFICQCGQSKIWTNSVRNEDALRAYLHGEPGLFEDGEVRYTNGFCNDKFEGNTLGELFPIRNGIDVPGFSNRLDRYGLKSADPSEPNIALDLFAEGGESDTGPILEWYRSRMGELEQMLVTSSAKNWLMKIAAPAAWLRSQGIPEEIINYALHGGGFPKKMQKWVAITLNKLLRSADGKKITFEEPILDTGWDKPSVVFENIKDFIWQLKDPLIMIKDWYMVAGRGIDIGRLDFVQAIQAADEWHEKMIAERGDGHPRFYTDPDSYAEDLGDGFKMVRVSEADLDNEGAIMQHCVGDGAYDNNVEQGNSLIFSLRDAGNNPHTTIEVTKEEFDASIHDLPDDYYPDYNEDTGLEYDEETGEEVDTVERRERQWQIEQIQGKQNKAPIDKYRPYIKKWLVAHPEYNPHEDDILRATPNDELLAQISANRQNASVLSNLKKYLDPEGAQKLIELILERTSEWSPEAIEESLVAAREMFGFDTEDWTPTEVRQSHMDFLIPFLSLEYADRIRSRAAYEIAQWNRWDLSPGSDMHEWVKEKVVAEKSDPSVAAAFLGALEQTVYNSLNNPEGEQEASSLITTYPEDVIPIAMDSWERFKEAPMNKSFKRNMFKNMAERVDPTVAAEMFTAAYKATGGITTYELRNDLANLSPRKFWDIWSILPDNVQGRITKDDANYDRTLTVPRARWDQLKDYVPMIEALKGYESAQGKYNGDVYDRDRTKQRGFTVQYENELVEPTFPEWNPEWGQIAPKRWENIRKQSPDYPPFQVQASWFMRMAK